MPDDCNPVQWITTQQAAALTGYDLTHIRRLVRENHIKGKKFGRDWMVSKESIQAYAEKMKKLGPAKHDPWRTGARRRDDKGE